MIASHRRLKAERPHSRKYTHIPTDYRHADNDLKLVMGVDWRTDGRRQTDGCYQFYWTGDSTDRHPHGQMDGQTECIFSLLQSSRLRVSCCQGHKSVAIRDACTDSFLIKPLLVRKCSILQIFWWYFHKEYQSHLAFHDTLWKILNEWEWQYHSGCGRTASYPRGLITPQNTSTPPQLS